MLTTNRLAARLAKKVYFNSFPTDIAIQMLLGTMDKDFVEKHQRSAFLLAEEKLNRYIKQLRG